MSIDGKLETDTTHEPLTVDENAMPVEDRLPTVDAAFNLFTQYRQAMVKIAMNDARVIAVHRGTPPYEDAKLKALGQSWRANLNTRELKGSVNNRADAAFDFHMDVDTRIKVQVRHAFKKRFQAPDTQEDFGQIIAEEYSYMLNTDWPENYFLVDQTTRDRVKLGLGAATWRDHLDWRPYYAPKMNVFLDPSLPPVAEKIPAVCIRDTLPIQDLIQHIKNPDRAKKLGWNVDVLKQVILAFWKPAGQNVTGQPAAAKDPVIGSWAAYEQWKTSKPAESPVFELKNLPVIRFLMKAVDSDKVSHGIVPDPTVVTCKISDYMYKRLDQFDHMGQALWLNPYTFAEGTIGSVDGLGHDLLTYCELSSRMVCTALDGGMIGAGLILQASAGYDADELSVLRVGPTTIIPPGLSGAPANLAPDIGRTMELRSAVRGIVTNNVGMTRMNPELMEQAARGTRSTAEVSLEKSREFRIETNSANFEYLTWTKLHVEMFRRAVALRKMADTQPGAKEAKAFYKRCIDRGVPEELFTKADEALVVEVNRTIGDGSPTSRTQIWGSLMGIRGDMDEAGRRHTQREYTASMIGYRNVDAVFPLWDRNKIPSNERSIATLENNDFREGSYVPAGSDQIHVIHLDVHFEPLMEIARAYNENADNADVELILRMFASSLPHIQEHLQFLSSDETRKGFVAQNNELLKELVVFYRRVEKEAMAAAGEAQQLEQQRQQQVLQEMEQRMSEGSQVKLRKIELDAQLEGMRQQALAETRQWAKEAQEQLKREMASARMALEEEMAQRRMAMEEETARRKVELAGSK